MCSRHSQHGLIALLDHADVNAQRDVLLQLLALDRIGAGVTATELHGHLASLPLRDLACALASLERSGLLELRDGRLHATRALRHLHRLDLLAF
jgi:hypothetical protein